MRALFSGLLGTSIALLAGCDATYFSVEIDAQDVCVGNLVVPFLPSQLDGTFTETLSTSDLGFVLADGFDPRVEIFSFELTPIAGVEDLRFIESLLIQMAPESGAEELPVFDLIRMSGTDSLEGGALYTEPEAIVDISTYIAEGELVLSMELAGESPETPWVASLDLCAHTSATYKKSLR